MDKELKDLLLKDLCARLPYGVKVQVIGVSDYTNEYLSPKTKTLDYLLLAKLCAVVKGYRKDEIKPYLFPMSSMTEEQKKEFKEISKCEDENRNYGGFDSEGVYVIEIGKYEYEYDIDTTFEQFYFNDEIIDWFNKNHIDYRGLIEKGLAIDATNLNIY